MPIVDVSRSIATKSRRQSSGFVDIVSFLRVHTTPSSVRLSDATDNSSLVQDQARPHAWVSDHLDVGGSTRRRSDRETWINAEKSSEMNIKTSFVSSEEVAYVLSSPYFFLNNTNYSG